MLAPGARTHARRVLFGTLAGCVLLQVALVALVWRDPVLIREEAWQHRVRCYRERMAAQPDALTVVQLGSSRTMNGLAGSAGEPILAERLGQPVVLLNFGLAGAGSPIRRRIDLQRLLNDGVRPDLLLLELLPVGFERRSKAVSIGPELLPVNCLRLDEVRLMDRLASQERPGLIQEWFREQVVPASGYQIGLIGGAPGVVRPLVA